MILSPTLFVKQIANVFLMADSKIIGLRFTHGLFFLPGFWSGVRIVVRCILKYNSFIKEDCGQMYLKVQLFHNVRSNA